MRTWSVRQHTLIGGAEALAALPAKGGREANPTDLEGAGD
jgi:hypothetical protein